MPIRPNPTRRVAVACLILGCLIPIAARAHAILEDSIPPQGGRVPAGHVTLVLRYNSRVDKARSRLMLIRPDRSQTVLPIVKGGPPDVLNTSAELTKGAYTVRWNVLATDGHLTRGDVHFTVTEP